MKYDIPRILIAGTGSGCGKTTITCGLLGAMKKRKLDVVSFKSGPDYIDPMFHSRIIGTKSRNLDSFLLDENVLKYLFMQNSGDAHISVIEGVMGIYDGAFFNKDEGSANHISRLTMSPEILVMDARGKGRSLAAEARGYVNFYKNNIKGFILNSCSESMYKSYEKLLREETGIPCLGHLPNDDRITLGSRHLGLITAEEVADLKEKMDILIRMTEEYMDVDRILDLAGEAPAMEFDECKDIPDICAGRMDAQEDEPVVIGLARDRAFCFYYEDNIELFRMLGAEIAEFSPLKDDGLPEGISGMVIGGGYPELYISELTQNKPMMKAIKSAVDSSMPVYAECGGFMYLGKSINVKGQKYETVGAISGNSVITDRLVRFGYKTLKAKRNNLMCLPGDEIRCHEFHYSDSDNCGDSFTATGKRGEKFDAIIATDHIYAGYPHLHLWSNPVFAANFIEGCRDFRRKTGCKKQQ